MKILVSACLLGVACRYDGCARPDQRVIDLAREHTLIPICPEQLGGLPTPRTPSEYDGYTVKNREGKDVTAEFKRGALECVRLAKLLCVDLVILKDKSPSCGVGLRYSGRFDGRLTEGDGMTAALLKAEGIPVISCTEIDSYFDLAKITTSVSEEN